MANRPDILTDLFKKIETSFGRLKKRERVFAALLILAVFFYFYVNFIFKPQFKRLKSLKSQLAGFKNQISELKSQIPSLKEEKMALKAVILKNKQLKEDLVKLEKELPHSYRISQLLGELAKQAEGLAIDFSYIKPKASGQENEEEYVRLDIEMQLSAPYPDFHAYLSQLEKISAYLNITDIVIEEMKEGGFFGETVATLVLSTLLSRQGAPVAQAKAEEREKSFLEKILQRNPFVPSGEQAPAQQKRFVLSGITYAQDKSTAIINGEVYRQGDMLENKYSVQQILPNMVIVSYGRQTEILVLE